MQKKKILINTSLLTSGHAVRGVGFYTKNLISNLKLLENKNFRFISENEKNYKYDLIYYPYFDLFRITLRFFKKAKKQVVMIHDVTPLLYPQYYPPGIKGKLKFKINKYLLNKNIDAVVTNSETSKKDIIRFLSYDPNKIFAIHLAPNFKFNKLSNASAKKIVKKYNLPDNFVLYVGDVNWNKDILTLVKACIKAKKHLVIIGKNAASKNYDESHIENLPLKTLQDVYSQNKYIHILGFLENNELNAVWNLASIYCQPSLYEGFGMPVLEAMQAGVPVICSRTQALVEVAGDACDYFKTSNVENLTLKINKLFKSKILRKKYRTLGLEKAKEYSWEKTAAKTAQVFEDLLLQ